MVSLWGTKADRRDDSHAGGEEVGDGNPTSDARVLSSSNGRRSNARDLDERAPLLPRDAPREGYLSPDDPAVTPLNLWSIRALRAFTVIFLAATFVWWVLMLVSIFVTPPGMHTRGSGFTDFSFTTLTLFNLIIALMFFAIPSKVLEVSNLLVGFLLLVDMILIVSIQRLREQEGWPGIASVVWALIIAIYNLFVDRMVAWGKKEEEERLTGREETRRTLKEWLGVVAEAFAMTVVLVVTVLLTATLILRSSDASLEAPGRKYWVNDNQYQVHVYCRGSHQANVTVLIEAGEDPYEKNLGPFVDDIYEDSVIQRFCFWDRPGVAFSDNAPSPLSVGMTVDALSEALAQAGDDGPWIVVGPGVGSYYTRIFASRHPGNVKAIMLLDPDHEDNLSALASPKRGFLLWAWGILSPLGLQQLPGAIFKGRTREDRVWGISSYQSGRRIKSLLQENLMAGSLTKSEISMARNIQSPDVPLVVISSGRHMREDKTWREQQKDLTTITSKLVSWDIAKGAGREVWKSSAGEALIRRRLEELIKRFQ